MALNSNSLVELATVKTFLGIADVSQDSELERLINSASQSISNYCQRTLVTATHTEYQDGRRTNTLQLREWPILDATVSVFLDPGSEFAASSEIDSTTIKIHQLDTMLVWTSGSFGTGVRNIKIIYDAGLGTSVAATLPSDLEDACIQQVAWMYQMNNDRRQGIESKSKLGENVRFTLGLPEWVQELLEPYVRQELPVSNAPVRNS